MKAFIVGLCLLVSVGVAGASEDLSFTGRHTIAENLAEQLVRGTMAGASLADTLKLHADIDHQTSAIGDTCNRFKELRDYKRYSPCLEFYEGAASLGAITLLHTARYANDLGDKAMAKKLYRSVITTYTGSAYRSYVKRAEFALEDLKGN